MDWLHAYAIVAIVCLDLIIVTALVHRRPPFPVLMALTIPLGIATGLAVQLLL